MSDEPRIGQPLPRAGEAFVDPAKLVRYALDPESPEGRNKARVFRLALGIEQGDWEYLRDRVLDELPHRPVSRVRPPQRARGVTTWEVYVRVRGLNGRALLVLTAWAMTARGPELKSIRVGKKSMQDPPRHLSSNS